MAQVTEISRSRDINSARKSFRKLLKDSKNKEFHDKIFYEMGVFELKQKNLNEAISNFKESVRRGNNQKIDGEAFLRLGEIYYDTLKDYRLSQAYYDSAITSLPQDYENYEAIKTRQEILNEFVTHLNTIEWQDSLLRLSSMDTATIRASVESVVATKKKEEEARAKRKKRSNRVEISAQDNSSIFDNGSGNSEAVDWYFGNPSAMAIGQNEFVRVWGNLRLEDNWRRSSRESAPSSAQTNTPLDSVSTTESMVGTEGASEDPVDAEYNRLVQQIPKTDADKKAANDKIEEAYFELGDIYYFKLKENENAIDIYKKLLGRYPETRHEPEVLYTLYLIHKDSARAEADNYANLLKSKYPQSSFAKILINPDYLHESGLAVEKQKVFYKKAYEDFQNQNFIGAVNAIEDGLALGESSFSPNLKLLRILIVGETEDISKYQFQLDQFIKANEGNSLTAYATKLLETSRQFQQAEEKRKGIQYVVSFEEPHYFVVVHRRKDKIEGLITSSLEAFNSKNFQNSALKTSNLILNDEYGITFVADLSGKSAAVEYFKTFIEKRPSLTPLVNYNFHNFVITKDNFDIFYRTKGLDEYLKFFEKNYQTQNQ
jgi:tetratricopeptide (TPR) repeat protein